MFQRLPQKKEHNNQKRTVQSKIDIANHSNRQQTRTNDLPLGYINDLSVIQRKGVVGVTLSTGLSEQYTGEDVKIDTLTFGGRFETGLKKTDEEGKLSKTEGDHTIADTFIKKYQKDYLKEKDMNTALAFYFRLANEILCEVMPTDNVETYLKERYGDSRNEAHNTLKHIAFAYREGAYSLLEWNILFKDIVESYNMAYAKSLFSTQGNGTGGHGEQSGISALKKVKHPNETRGNAKSLEKSMNKLLDQKSVNKLLYTESTFETIAGIEADEAKGIIMNDESKDYQTAWNDELKFNSYDTVKNRFSVMKNIAIESRQQYHERYDKKMI